MKITQSQLGHSNAQTLSHYTDQIDCTAGHNTPLSNNNVTKDAGRYIVHLR